MPRRYQSEGSNPFQSELGPSAFNPNPPDDFINRQGEPTIWLRAMQRPSKMDPAKMPSLNQDPWIYRIETERRMPEETILNQEIEGLDLFTKFGPIKKLHNLYIFANPDQGGNVPLEADSFVENKITIRPNSEFNPDLEIHCDYTVQTFERRLYKPYIQKTPGKFLYLDSSEIIVKVLAIYRKDKAGKFIRLTGVSSDFTKIILSEPSESGREYILDLITYSPISIGYKTIDIRDKRLSEKSGFNLASGDLDLVVPSNINLSKDDILIPLRSLNTEKEWVRRDKDGRFPIKYSPVREIYGIYSDSKDYTNYRIEDARFISVLEPCPDDLMIVYAYNPRFIVLPDSNISAIARKVQPRKFNARLHQSNLDIARVVEHEGSKYLEQAAYFTGSTAYSIARENGYIGTEFEFMTFLKGPKGDSGDKTTQIGPEFSYDLAGNLTSIVYDSGSVKNFTYNSEGQLLYIDFTENSRTTRKTFNYNPDGQLTSIDEGDL